VSKFGSKKYGMLYRSRPSLFTTRCTVDLSRSFVLVDDVIGAERVKQLSWFLSHPGFPEHMRPAVCCGAV